MPRLRLSIRGSMIAVAVAAAVIYAGMRAHRNRTGWIASNALVQVYPGIDLDDYDSAEGVAHGSRYVNYRHKRMNQGINVLVKDRQVSIYAHRGGPPPMAGGLPGPSVATLGR